MMAKHQFYSGLAWRKEDDRIEMTPEAAAPLREAYIEAGLVWEYSGPDYCVRGIGGREDPRLCEICAYLNNRRDCHNNSVDERKEV